MIAAAEAASAFFELLALKKYDGSAKVTTYIYPHIQFRLRRWLEKNIGSMALKKDEMQRIRMVQRYYHVEQMTAEEIAETMNIPLSEVSEDLSYSTHALYVNDLVPEDGDAYIATTDTENPFYTDIFTVTVPLEKDISFLDWSDPENLDEPVKLGFNELLGHLLGDTDFAPYNTKVTFDENGKLVEFLYTYSPWN